MKEKNYYLEDSKQNGKRNANEISFMMEVYIQMVIDEALFKRKKSILEEKVNQALDQKDQDAFLKYSNELKLFV